tara:strand:- start:973 stop:1578 length:606 start_codon:yes stop_codon:yes gene_type:complete
MAYYKRLITGAWAKCKVLDRTDYFTYIQVLDSSHAKARKLWVDSDFVVPKEEKPKDMKKLKYLQDNNGTWFYRRSIPTKLLKQPFWKGKKFWSQSLELGIDSDCYDAVVRAWYKADQDFKRIIKQQENQLMTWDDHVQEAIDNGKLCEAWLWSLDASGNLAVEDKETLVVKHLKDYFYDHYVGTMDSEEIDNLLDLGWIDE